MDFQEISRPSVRRLYAEIQAAIDTLQRLGDLIQTENSLTALHAIAEQEDIDLEKALTQLNLTVNRLQRLRTE